MLGPDRSHIIKGFIVLRWLEPTAFGEGNQGKEVESVMRKLVH